MDTDDDKDLKPPLSNVTNTTVNTSSGVNGTTNSSSTPMKLKEEIKEEPMEIEINKSQEKKNVNDKDKTTFAQSGGNSGVPMVNGTLSDSDKELETNVRCLYLYK